MQRRDAAPGSRESKQSVGHVASSSKKRAVAGGLWCDDVMTTIRLPDTAAMVKGDAMPLLGKGAPIRLESGGSVVGHRRRG
jgi:hypothetical protein